MIRVNLRSIKKKQLNNTGNSAKVKEKEFIVEYQLLHDL